VDDKEENLYYLQRLLTAHGYEVETARNGEEALQKAQQTLPELVISDLLMPVIDGYTFLRMWKGDARLNPIPFIVYTATYTAPSDKDLALKLGADDFILKPCEPDEFIIRIQRVLKNREPKKPEAAKSNHVEDEEVLQEYSQTLIRKLEQKTLELEQVNRSLNKELEERKIAEAQIREQAALLDAANEAIYVQDLQNNNILFWNKGAERIYGWSRKEALGKNAVDLIYKNSSGYEEALSFLKANGEWQGEFVHHCKVDTPMIIESNWTLLKNESGTPKSILTINSDVTDKKELEKQFLRAQRMESIGTLAGGIAHDLNNMLTPILMAIELLNDIVKDTQGRTLLNSMQDSAERGAALIKQVLSFARGVEGERVAVNPIHILRELITVMRETFPKYINISFEAETDSWAIIGDPTQVHQVLLNMFVNARDAMPDGGELCIQMQNKQLSDPVASANIDARAGSYVLFRISDTGMGMSQHVVDKIFEPFFTTKSFGKGTGLGLSTTLAIVRSHKGFIDVTSEEGKGTAFDIYFPAQARALPAKKQTPLHPALPEGNGEWILAVEDEDAIRNVLKHTLERFGYQVLLAGNGKEAVQIYAEHEKKISVVLTDVSMPVMDGPGTILAIKKINPMATIIMSSGLTTSEDISDEIRDLVTAYIPKPYATEIMLTTLHQVLHTPSPKPKSTSHPS
jgi:PAS domain S-box-containing protein